MVEILEALNGNEAQPLNIPLIGKLAASSQIVGVGESTHGTHEFFEFKSSLFMELVENHGFNTFMLEDSEQTCKEINEYIRTGEGDLGSIMKRLYPIWQVEEVKDFIVQLNEIYPMHPVKFIGFDIFQSDESLKKRDELMAKNIFDYVKASPKTKAFVSAHNTHIKYAAADKFEESMGSFLRLWLGKDYFAIAQFFGTGSFSATAIDMQNPDWSNRKLSPLRTPPLIPSDFLEAKLQEIGDTPYYLSNIGISAFKELHVRLSARSIGWGLVPSQVNEITSETNVEKDYSLLVYFPVAKHSQPLT